MYVISIKLSNSIKRRRVFMFVNSVFIRNFSRKGNFLRTTLAKSIFLLLLCVFIAPVVSIAQKVGEAYVKDGIPCIIIYVDETSRSGLVMTTIPKPKALKAAKSVGNSDNNKWFYLYPESKKGERKLTSEYLKELYTYTKCDTYEVRTSRFTSADKLLTSLSGKENMKNVIDYCNEKNISMETFFPWFAWAQSLGPDWYIPGVEELNLYVRMFGFEAIGKDYKQGIFEVGKKDKELWKVFNNSIENTGEKELYDDVITKTFPFSRNCIFSSTLSETGFVKLLLFEVAYSNMYTLYEIVDANYCAVSEVQFK